MPDRNPTTTMLYYFLFFSGFFVQFADMSRHTIFTLFGLVMCMDWVRMHLEVGLKQAFRNYAEILDGSIRSDLVEKLSYFPSRTRTYIMPHTTVFLSKALLLTWATYFQVP
jgi:hypothetical protein